MTKILIIRFSSIGDIVLITPLLRCIKTQMPDSQIDFVTKKQYENLLNPNPHIHQIIALGDDWKSFQSEVKKGNYDYVIDLHHNLRSLRLKLSLSGRKYSVNKLNLLKWLLVRFKVNKMPDKHIVDRYFETVKPLGIVNDEKGVDFHLPNSLEWRSDFPQKHTYWAYCIGGQFATKKMPVDKIVELCDAFKGKMILVGGKEDEVTAISIIKKTSNSQVIHFCGSTSLFESALLVKHAQKVITHDTGMMHIASAFDVPIVSVWGNTVPEFGMYPYRKENVQIIQKEGLSCRPCSKIGYQKCPKGHFKCMDHDIKEIIED